MSNKQQIKIDDFFKKLLKELQSTKTINDIELAAFKAFVNKENSYQVINSIKKIGLFRPSKYDFNVKIILCLLNIIKESNNFNNFNLYFIQIDCLLTLAKGARDSLKKIREILLSNSNLVKLLFAKGDDIFYENAGTSNPEIILECISFLILECRKNQYSHGLNLSFINTINEADFNKLINFSKDILIFKKMEIKLDFFGYEIKKQGNHTYLLSNPSFEKNLSFSYLNYDQQRYSVQKKHWMMQKMTKHSLH